MSYFNNVFVIFGIGGETPRDYRTAGQALPRGAVPLCIINGETKVYTEIINAISPQEAFKFLSDKIFTGEWEDEELKKEREEEFRGGYTLNLSTSAGWGFRNRDIFKVEIGN